MQLHKKQYLSCFSVGSLCTLESCAGWKFLLTSAPHSLNLVHTSKNLRNWVTLPQLQTSNLQALNPASTLRTLPRCVPYQPAHVPLTLFHPALAIVHMKTTKISCNMFHHLWKFLQWSFQSQRKIIKYTVT